MKISLRFCLFFFLLTPYCSSAQSTYKGMNGVEYPVYSNGGTQKVREKRYVIMHGILKLANDQTDSLIFDSDQYDQPEVKPLLYNDMPKELADVFNKAISGDSLIIKLPLHIMIPDETERNETKNRWDFVLFIVKIRGVYKTKREAINAQKEFTQLTDNKEVEDDSFAEPPPPPPPPPPPAKNRLRSQTNADQTNDPNEDLIFTKVETEARFPGNWTNYLMEHLNADLPSKNNAPVGTYTVIVRFVVDKNGEIRNVIAENNPGYGLAKEAVRVIKASGRWSPGVQNGRPVTCYKRQPITWMVQ
ncbi:MAG: energy transducer TonB [Ferruginibacter sp.]